MANAIRANSVYVVVDGPSWILAKQNAEEAGGTPAKVESEAENIFLVSSFSGALNQAWIGLSDEGSEGNWYWTDGELLSNSPYKNWHPVEPLNEYYSSSRQYANYGAIYFTNTNWTPAIPGKWADLPNAASLEQFSYYNEMVGIAEIPLSLSVDIPNLTKEGGGVFTTSINLSAGTATSGNLADGATVYWKVAGITAEDLESGDLTGSGTITGGRLDIQHSLLQDEDTGELFEVSVFSNESMTPEYQIRTIAYATIEEGIPDPLTGILDLPGKVNLKKEGQTPFTLLGSNEIDVTRIDLESLGFGREPDSVVKPSTKKNGSIFASLEDANNDGIMDLTVMVDTSVLASIIPKDATYIRAFGQYGDGAELLFGLAKGDSVLFF